MAIARQADTRSRVANWISPIHFTPFDLRLYVRLTLIVLCWKHASQDYSALTYLADRNPLITHALSVVQTLTHWVQINLLSIDGAPPTIQLLGIVACIVAIIRPNRLTLSAAFGSVSLLEFPAFQWRYQNWDFDLPLAVLLMIIVSPVSLKRALSTSRVETFEAQFVGWLLASYMAWMYFLAGLSKPLFDLRWPILVQFENNWVTQFIDITQYAPWMVFSEIGSRLFHAAPWVGATIGAVVMIDQLLMPLALINRHIRQIGPAVIFANHCGIALLLGIFFSSMPFLGPAIFVPWSALLPGRKTSPAVVVQRDLRSPFMLVTAAAIAFALVMLPGLSHQVYHPFADNFIFGWRYPSGGEHKTIGAIGFRNPKTGDLLPIPRGNGGFLESRLNTSLEASARVALESKNGADIPLDHLDMYRIETYLCATRPMGSNFWLLGSLALPEHRFSKFNDFRLADHQVMYLIEGLPQVDQSAPPYQPITVRWTEIAKFKAPTCR